MVVRHIGDAAPRVPTRVLNGSGTRVSAFVLGVSGWARGVTAESAQEMARTYLAAGGHTFEMNDVDAGAAEVRLREALEGRRREEYQLVARNGRHGALPFAPGPDTSRAGLMAALDATLERLGTEHVDLWLVEGDDGVTPSVEVASALEWAVTTGRASDVGLSDVPAWRAVDVSHMLAARGVHLVAHAVEHHLLRADATDVVEAAAARGYGVIAGAGLARGVLTGKYRHGTPADSRRASGDLVASGASRETTRAVVESLATAADGLGVHPAELALAWSLHAPGIDAVVAGSRTAAQLRVALRAGELSVPREIVVALDEVAGA